MLKEVIRKWWRVELAFADGKGYVLDHAEGKVIPPNNDFCRLALFSKEGFRRCNESVKVTRDKLRGSAPRAGRRCVVHECHLGFDVIACPIVLDGDFAGFLFVGGSVHEALSPQSTELLMRKIREVAQGGGNGTDLHKAVGKIPQMTEEEIDQLCDLLEFGADEIQNYHGELKRREKELTSITQELGERYRFENIVGTSRSMQQVFRLLEKIIESESTVLINGESGTGKELVAGGGP
jgi:ligand-binding sensor protein